LLLFIDKFMSRALVVVTDGNPAKLNFLARNYAKYVAGEVDKVYITVGTGYSFSPQVVESLQAICADYNFKFVFPPYRDIAQQLDAALYFVEEDYVGFVEDDLWILNKGVIHDRFSKLENQQVNLVATTSGCGYRPEFFTKFYFDSFGELLKTQTPHEITNKCHLWSSWLFIKTSELRKCIKNYLNCLSENCVVTPTLVTYPNNSVTEFFKLPPFKQYQNAIYTTKFWTGKTSAGCKLPILHSDWIFTHNCEDEIMQLASPLLIKHCKFKLHLEFLRIIDTENIHTYFDTKNLTANATWADHTDWIHGGCLGGNNGIFGAVRDKVTNQALLHHPLHDVPYAINDLPISDPVRYGINLAFANAWNRNDLVDFIDDYKQALYHNTLDIHKPMMQHIAAQFCSRLI